MAVIVGLVAGFLLSTCAVIIAVVVAADLEDRRKWKKDA